MAKCNTKAHDMATTANNWRTPGATNPGRYIGDHDDYDRHFRKTSHEQKFGPSYSFVKSELILG